MRDPRARANYLAAMKRHDARLYADAVEFLGMFRSEIAGEATEPLTLEDRADTGTADMIAALVRIAHDRQRLGRDVAASFKDVAAAVGISPERLTEAVRAALETDLAA